MLILRKVKRHPKGRGYESQKDRKTLAAIDANAEAPDVPKARWLPEEQATALEADGKRGNRLDQQFPVRGDVMTTEEIEKALSGVQITLSRIFGHLAITQQRERDLRHAGYQQGHAAGFKAGKEAGFQEGWEEARVFPAEQV